MVADDFNPKAARSAYNPQGLPERTVREVHMQEFGPVTFPAYAGATAGMRSRAVQPVSQTSFLALIDGGRP